ncbi:MAG TPA: HlyD family secretion protein [Candidatus Binataceae bacterium]|nr:HlyD family secretion protein [Candidatus Binataceae bacterium]
MQRISIKRVVLVAVIIAVIIVGFRPALRYYRFEMSHVSTDDAYVDGQVVLISSRINGTVKSVFIDDNWIVKRGDPLVLLDDKKYAVAVEQARAQLARARLLVDEQFAQLTEAGAAVRLARAQIYQTKRDYERAKALLATGVISQQSYDQALTAYRAAQAELALAQQGVVRARATLGGDVADHARYDLPVVKQAEAELKTAMLNLSYTKINAPLGGVITRKNVDPGNRVEAGEPLLAIVPVDSLYVTANFKENQLTYVRVGQPVAVSADIYPGFTFEGRVDSIALGTGAAFSLLPPENATGNWVKVVQRVPVKIVFDKPAPPDKQLRLGLSVEAAIDISNTHGPLISSLMQKKLQEGGGQHPTIPESPAP